MCVSVAQSDASLTHVVYKEPLSQSAAAGGSSEE